MEPLSKHPQYNLETVAQYWAKILAKDLTQCMQAGKEAMDRFFERAQPIRAGSLDCDLATQVLDVGLLNDTKNGSAKQIKKVVGKVMCEKPFGLYRVIKGAAGKVLLRNAQEDFDFLIIFIYYCYCCYNNYYIYIY